MLTSSIKTNMSVIEPIFYHWNETIQILNLQPWPLKVCDDISYTKIQFISICDTTMINIWQAKKETCGNYTTCCATIPKGSHDMLITQITLEEIWKSTIKFVTHL